MILCFDQQGIAANARASKWTVSSFLGLILQKWSSWYRQVDDEKKKKKKKKKKRFLKQIPTWNIFVTSDTMNEASFGGWRALLLNPAGRSGGWTGLDLIKDRMWQQPGQTRATRRVDPDETWFFFFSNVEFETH
jgi:hypothetical protein